QAGASGAVHRARSRDRASLDEADLPERHHARRQVMRRLLLLISFIGAVTACVSNEPSDVRFFPDKEEFINGGVSAMMEARCGGLDCHGQVGRPLRIYGQRGLRLATPETDLRDERPTTPEERLENYQSVIGLEPEG